METRSRPDEIINFQIVFETRTLLWRVYVCQSFFFFLFRLIFPFGQLSWLIHVITMIDSLLSFDFLPISYSEILRLETFFFFSYGVNIAFEILSNEYLEY